MFSLAPEKKLNAFIIKKYGFKNFRKWQKGEFEIDKKDIKQPKLLANEKV